MQKKDPFMNPTKIGVHKQGLIVIKLQSTLFVGLGIYATRS